MDVDGCRSCHDADGCLRNQLELVQGANKVDAGKQQTSVKADEQGESFSQRAFLQMVSDNQVYAKDIVGKMDFTILMGDKEVSVPAKLSMRKDQLVRIQIFMPFLGNGWGVSSLLLIMC